MTTTVTPRKNDPPVPWGQLPPRMRVLLITGPDRTGGWLAEALAADSSCRVHLEEAVGATAGLARLRDEIFDAAMISHEPGQLDALDLIEGIRAGGSDQLPILVLGAASEQESDAVAFEAGADAYLCVHTTTTRALIWQLARARERHCLIAENRRFAQQQRHRLKQEQTEANRLLAQQRALIEDRERIGRDARSGFEGVARGEPNPSDAGWDDQDAVAPLPESLTSHYCELLRAYVVMGTGNLQEEMRRLADQLARSAASARQVMQLHLLVLEQTLQGLGSRSARHVMNRADLLVLEVLIHLADGYRRRCGEQRDAVPGCRVGR